jgi:hypothetical protein
MDVIQPKKGHISLTFGPEYVKIVSLALLRGMSRACGSVVCFHFSLNHSSAKKQSENLHPGMVAVGLPWDTPDR